MIESIFLSILLASYYNSLYYYIGISDSVNNQNSEKICYDLKNDFTFCCIYTCILRSILCFFNFWYSCFYKKCYSYCCKKCCSCCYAKIKSLILLCFEKCKSIILCCYQKFCSCCHEKLCVSRCSKNFKLYVSCFFDKSKTFFSNLFMFIETFFNYFGRIIYTILSLEALFFFHNFVIESALIFIGLLIDMENKFFYFIFCVLYIFFIIFFLDILIIPTYEFINFQYLRLPDSNSHLNSFKYIIKNSKSDHTNSNQNNNDDIDKSLTNFGILYFIFFFNKLYIFKNVFFE